MSEAFKRFGLFLGPEQLEEIKRLYQASEGPLMGFSYKHILSIEEGYRKARDTYHDTLDAMAVALGLPQPREDPELGTYHYGLDFRTGEILGVLE